MVYQRGDIVLCVLSGDYGKPRPAVIVQSDVFNPTHASLTVCPLTSYIADAPLFRLSVVPSTENGLKFLSQIMVDKISTLKIEKIREKIGSIGDDLIHELNAALRLWLDI